MDEQFIARLLGALVGGIASFVGSVVVNRRELMRAARVRLHDELLPALEAAIEFDNWGEHELKGVPGAWRLFAVQG